ncbi:MAG: transketolase, partial [Actinobacteria bacterium]|nr:transketolase [Actinomycetota bacterium]
LDRDRFVLSNGHASMLLYSLLHLSGFPLTIADIKDFRQLESLTAGHPEKHSDVGIEVTTGPLGQGFGMGVGLAIAEEHLRARFGEDLVDHRTFGFVSDGDLMEGISAESASIAGHLGLGRLLYFYDDNNISIDGNTDITFSEDVGGRFRAVGWEVDEIDGHDRYAIAEAIEKGIDEIDRPSLVITHTHIAQGAPTAQDTAKAHGAPLGDEEIRATKEAMGWPVDEAFTVPEDVSQHFRLAMDRGREAHQQWDARMDKAGDLAAVLKQFNNEISIKLDGPKFDPKKPIATRAASGQLFEEIAEKAPNFLGGAADLVESTKTEIKASTRFSRQDRRGRNIAFGVREHAMGAITNGINAHGGLRSYAATFFIFSDYMRPAIRLSALMEVQSIWVYTHESIFLGEDGPTHQPIEHLASLRAMPGIWVVRPADATETVEAWQLALNRNEGPTVLLFTRQNLPVLEREAGGVARGGYVLREGDDLVLVATGSEVSLALEVADMIDRSVRVVSLPCWELFLEQDDDYRESVLGEDLPRVSIEAGATFGWERIIGSDGLAIGIDRFGASAPAADLASHFGFTPEAVAHRINAWLR